MNLREGPVHYWVGKLLEKECGETFPVLLATALKPKSTPATAVKILNYFD